MSFPLDVDGTDFCTFIALTDALTAIGHANRLTRTERYGLALKLSIFPAMERMAE
jgi:hypothetical protein